MLLGMSKMEVAPSPPLKGDSTTLQQGTSTWAGCVGSCAHAYSRFSCVLPNLKVNIRAEMYWAWVCHSSDHVKRSCVILWVWLIWCKCSYCFFFFFFSILNNLVQSIKMVQPSGFNYLLFRSRANLSKHYHPWLLTLFEIKKYLH